MHRIDMCIFMLRLNSDSYKSKKYVDEVESNLLLHVIFVTDALNPFVLCGLSICLQIHFH